MNAHICKRSLKLVSHAFVVAVVALMSDTALAQRPPQTADANAAATELVRAVVDEGAMAIAEARTSGDRQRIGLASIYGRAFATDAIGETLLGDHWRTASASEQRQFVAVFGQYLADRLISKFPTGEFVFLETEGADGSNADSQIVTVRTVFETITSSHVIEWRVGTVGREMRIFDILIGGSSLIEDKQREFASILRENDGEVGALIASLGG